MSKILIDEAKLSEVLEALEFIPQSGSMLGSQAETKRLQAIAALREALANEALDKMAENARELGLDYEPALCAPAADGVCESLDCPNHKPAQQEPVRVPVTDNTYNYAKNLAEAIFKQHFASDEHYSSGRIVWGVNDTVIGILTQIDNMVADMVRKPPIKSRRTHETRTQVG